MAVYVQNVLVGTADKVRLHGLKVRNSDAFARLEVRIPFVQVREGEGIPVSILGVISDIGGEKGVGRSIPNVCNDYKTSEEVQVSDKGTSIPRHDVMGLRRIRVHLGPSIGVFEDRTKNNF